MSLHILAVDDDPLILQVLRTVLDLEDLRVSTATGGEEALTLVDQEIPDVVVCDVMMPDMDGFEVCRRIKGDARTAHVPVILLTARDRAEDRAAGEAAGCDRYLTKPFSPLHLIDVITELVPGPTGSGSGAARGGA